MKCLRVPRRPGDEGQRLVCWVRSAKQPGDRGGCALFEGGEHGNLAAPIVRDVIKAYFDKKVRNDPQNLLASLPAFPSRQ